MRRRAVLDVVAPDFPSPLLVQIDGSSGNKSGRENVETTSGECVPLPSEQRTAPPDT